MAEGANGVELDLKFNHEGEAVAFRHGRPCDCSCLCPEGNACAKENVCFRLWRATDSHCNAQEDVDKMMKELARYSNQLSVIYIDSKVDAEGIDLEAAGVNVIALLDKAFKRGFRGQVIIGAPYIKQEKYLRSAAKSAAGSPYKESYFFTIDGEEDEFLKVAGALIQLETDNRIYSTGITTCWGRRFYSEIQLAASNQERGVLGGTGIWTLDDESSMTSYLSLGADLIVTNFPGLLVEVIESQGLKPAKPGEALSSATSKKVFRPTSTCSEDQSCANRACGRKTAADNAPLVCCSSGDTTFYAGFDYCTKMPNNSICWADAMCASEYCRNNEGGLRKGICGKLPVGSSCDRDADCENDACGRKTAADRAPLVCCPSGDTTFYGGFDYCTKMPDGSTCWSDFQCASGRCRDNRGGLKKGECFGKSPAGSSCSHDVDCENDACGRKTAADRAPLVCCPSGDTTFYAGFDYCTKMPKGSICWADSMCSSGLCKGNMSGLRKGKCK